MAEGKPFNATSRPAYNPTYTVATAPLAADYEGHTIYVTDDATGGKVLAYSDGTNWLRSDTRAAIA